MFLTIGLVIGFVLGWYVNEKFEDLAWWLKWNVGTVRVKVNPL